MKIIEKFVKQYAKEFDFYDQAARIAARKLESNLQREGIRAIVTSRAKSIPRLEEKLHKRNPKKLYKSIEDIHEDIIDLAGVRVALYFPGEREQAGKVIDRIFREHDTKKIFPETNEKSPKNRFSGYSAVHYRVQLDPSHMDETEKRYASAKIEIQVASVLMHAWAEVEHDLVYKPFNGELSSEEYSLLDQLNGLVLAGEISLEQLQQAGKARVRESGRTFANHYELASYLVSSASSSDIEEVTDQGLGRVDLLFNFIKELGLSAADSLRPYLQNLHNNLEIRPLSEQIIDALLEEDQSRYEKFFNIQKKAGANNSETPQKNNINHEFGRFLSSWIILEKLLRELLPVTPQQQRVPLTTGRMINEITTINDETRFEINQLRVMRNRLVHGIETPPAEQLKSAADRMEGIIQELNEQPT
ncbi:GTP pyrophosphokinase family protein [Nocardiopsis flavescens]|uniref:GTP pyrophosphokinase n=1 Tax=Nocardiopsis flavescens TaxID=758803 RepID=UPI00365EA87B